MIVYRLSHKKYASSLSSSGASNRWNKMFQFVIYCSENISLCALELLAHTNGVRPVGKFSLMRIEIEDPVIPHVVELSNLPKIWHHLYFCSLNLIRPKNSLCKSHLNNLTKWL